MMDISSLQNSFFNPPREYSPAPFWFLNDNVTRSGIVVQLAEFREKGFYGFIPHPRIGMSREIGYMTPKYLDPINCAAEEATAHGMYIILYDEASYPSGSAHGEVAKKYPEYANKGLEMQIFTREGAQNAEACVNSSEVLSVVSIQTATEINGEFTDIRIHGDFDSARSDLAGSGADRRLLVFAERYSKAVIRGLFPDEDDSGANPPLYADVLNRNAVEKVLELGFDPFYERLKPHFGKTIIGMFTDEPSPTGRGFPGGLRPWTSGLLSFMSKNGIYERDLCRLWDRNGELLSRWNSLCDKLMLDTYYKPLSRWCTSRNIALTGHPHAGNDIRSEKFFGIPGQDVVWRYLIPESSGGRRRLNGNPLEKSSDKKLVTLVEKYGCGLAGEQSTQGKCSADAALHRGRKRSLNECFGAYGWDLRFEEIKWLTDWLLVRGVNLLAPHAFYYSVRGERSGERPPDVGPNNLWWPHMKLFSDYAARLCAFNADASNTSEVAVIVGDDGCPYAPCIPLYTGQIEFNYLEASLFDEGAVTAGGGTLSCASQSYRNIVCREDLFAGKVRELCEKSGVRVVLYTDDNAVEAVERARLAPTVLLSPPSPNIRVSKRIYLGHIAYFFTNEGDCTFRGTVLIREKSEKALLLDAWRGSSLVCPIVCGELPLSLCARESVVAVLLANGEEILPRSGDMTGAMVCENGTDLEISYGKPYVPESGQTLAIPVPGLWNGLPGMDGFAGTVVYPFTFCFDGSDSGVCLSVSDVHDFCALTVNGKNAGVCFWPPFSFDISGFVTQGANEARLFVTNSLANRYDKKNLPSGFTGMRARQYNIQKKT